MMPIEVLYYTGRDGCSHKVCIYKDSPETLVLARRLVATFPRIVPTGMQPAEYVVMLEKALRFDMVFLSRTKELRSKSRFASRSVENAKRAESSLREAEKLVARASKFYREARRREERYLKMMGIWERRFAYAMRLANNREPLEHLD